jgi:carboxymethylenebutenolidase
MPSFWEVLRVPAEGSLLDDMAAYVSQDNNPGKKPAVIVIQEAFGVDAHIQAVTDRFAAAGYFAVAPALYHREGTTEEIRGTNPVYTYGGDDAAARSDTMGNLRDDNIILDINTTIEWLNRHQRVLGDRIGIVGFCVGGRITYLAASSCPGLSAASVYYGGRIMLPFGDGPTPFDRTSKVQCPVLGNFGELDKSPTPEDVHKIEAELQKHGKTYDFKIFPGADHGFNCDDRASFHQPSAQAAWARTLDWFKKYLA